MTNLRSLNRRVLSLAVLTMLGTGVLACAAQTVRAQADPKVAAQLIELEQKIGDANIRRDKAFFQKIEAEEFIFTDSSGGRTTKAEDVASLDKPVGETKLIDFKLSDTEVRTYGNVAVVLGQATWTYKRGEREIILHTRFTDVFVKRRHTWQIVAGHSSRIPDPPKAE